MEILASQVLDRKIPFDREVKYGGGGRRRRCMDLGPKLASKAGGFSSPVVLAGLDSIKAEFMKVLFP